jgi:hypothetical protein
MKYILLFFIISPVSLLSQEVNKYDELGRITLNVILPEDSKIPSDTKEYFIGKLIQIVTSNGLAGTEISNPRFILTGSITELNHEQLSESLLHFIHIEIVLHVIDLNEKKIFNTLTVPLKGVGDTKTKAYLDCIKRIGLQTKEVRSFLETGKLQILNYYNSQCDFIQSKAKILAKQNKYDEAIYGLSLVPDVSKNCYNLSSSNMIEIYTAKINFECRQSIDNSNFYMSLNRFDEAIGVLTMILPTSDCYIESRNKIRELQDKRCLYLLSKAKSSWAASNIEDATSYLSQISFESKCKIEVIKLIDEIKRTVKERENRDWDVKMKIQNDEVDLKKAIINAAKEVGVSYGKSQPQTLIYQSFKTFW